MKNQFLKIAALLVTMSSLSANADQKISFDNFQTAAKRLLPYFDNGAVCNYTATLTDDEVKLVINNGSKKLEVLVKAKTDRVVSYTHLVDDYTDAETYTFANGGSLKTKFTEYYEEMEVSDGATSLACDIDE